MFACEHFCRPGTHARPVLAEVRSWLQQQGQLHYALDAVKWGSDYLIKAHTKPNEMWGQVRKTRRGRGACL